MVSQRAETAPTLLGPEPGVVGRGRVSLHHPLCAPICPKNATLRPMIGTTAPWPCQGFENEQGFLCSAGWHPACCKSSVRDGRKKGKRTGYRFCRSNTERSGGFYSSS